MKTYVSINECDTGSTGTIARGILEEFENSGYRVFMYVHNKKHNDDDRIRLIKSSRIEYFLGRVFCKFDGSDGFHNTVATKHLIDELSSLDPDVIHLHNIHGHYINIPLFFRFLAKSKARVIWTFHDCWPFTGKCAYFSFSGCEKWKSAQCKHCREKGAYPKAYLINGARWLFQRKRRAFLSIKDRLRIITPSIWLQKLALGSFFASVPIRCIHNGVSFTNMSTEDDALRLRKTLGIDPAAKVVFSAASPFSKRKGLNYIKGAADSFDDNSLVFVVAGLKPEQEKYLPPNVLSVGKVSQEKIQGFFRMADIFLNPTLEDNYPTVNIESIISGTPVVTFDSGGSSETVLDGCGIVVKQKTIPALVLAIKAAFQIELPLVYDPCFYSVKKMGEEYVKEANIGYISRTK